MRADSWQTTTLGEIADLVIGRTPPRKEPSYWTSDCSLPFCTIADMQGRFVNPTREGITDQAEADGKAKRVPAGALLMSFKLTIGRVGFAGRDLFPNEAIVWVRPKDPDEVCDRYLAAYLESFDYSRLTGRAVKGETLNKTSMKSIPVLLPPPQEQRRIADLIWSLDTLLERVDALRVSTKEARDASITALLVSLAAADTVPLSDIVHLRRVRIDPRLAKTRVFKHYSIPAFDESGAPVVEPGARIESHKFVVEENAVLVSLLNPRIRRVWKVRGDSDSICSTEFAVLVPKRPDLHLDFLFAVTDSPYFQRELQRVEKGTTGSRKRVAPEALLDFQIPVTGARQQEELSHVVNAAERQLVEMSRYREAAIVLRRSLITALLTGEHAVPPSYDRFLRDADAKDTLGTLEAA